MRLTGIWLWVIWNSFLALVPVALAQVICRAATVPKKGTALKVSLVLLTLTWLAFLPNTCYLFTEWRHFLARLDASDLYLRSQQSSGLILRLMIETAAYACYAGFGMLTFVLAIRPIERLARKRFVEVWPLAIPLFILLSVGVYLGLILRFNSWELLTRPMDIGRSVAALAYRPTLSLLIIAFAGFLWLAYIAIDIWIDGFLVRWRGTRKP